MSNEASRSLDLRETQLAALKILKVIDEICRKNDLRYWVMYGSLIGAVRHQGFIPWDDDLDIAMPRPDYEKLIAYFKEHSEDLKPLVVVAPEADRGLPFLITRISDTSYKMIGEYGDYVDELGSFVDVYPLDGCGSSLEEAQAHIVHARHLADQYWLANNHPKYRVGNGVLKRAVKALIATFMGSSGKYIKKLDEAGNTYDFDGSEYVAQIGWSALPGQPPFKRSWFDETRYVPFEDMEAPIPAEYESVLGIDYDNYLQIPPKEEQVSHHEYRLIKRFE